jgi:hypothetical protein
MNDAIGARGLGIAEYAPLRAARRILDQLTALVAKRPGRSVIVTAAILLDHGGDGPDFPPATDKTLVGREFDDWHSHAPTISPPWAGGLT